MPDLPTLANSLRPTCVALTLLLAASCEVSSAEEGADASESDTSPTTDTGETDEAISCDVLPADVLMSVGVVNDACTVGATLCAPADGCSLIAGASDCQGAPSMLFSHNANEPGFTLSTLLTVTEASAGTITSLDDQFFVIGMPLGETTTISLVDESDAQWSLAVTTTGAAACPEGVLDTSLALRVLSFER